MTKSIPLAFILPLMFGPLGVLYVDKRLGITMLLASVVLFVITLMPFGHYSELAGIRLVSVLVFVVACVGVSVTEALYINSLNRDVEVT